MFTNTCCCATALITTGCQLIMHSQVREKNGFRICFLIYFVHKNEIHRKDTKGNVILSSTVCFTCCNSFSCEIRCKKGI